MNLLLLFNFKEPRTWENTWTNSTHHCLNVTSLVMISTLSRQVRLHHVRENVLKHPAAQITYGLARMEDCVNSIMEI